MKYKQFILLRNLVFGFLSLGVTWLLYNNFKQKKQPAVATHQQKEMDAVGNPQNARTYTLTTDETITAIHQEIISFQTNAKLSDGQPDPNNNGVKFYKKFDTYTLDLRCDKQKGFHYFNRLKIDWDQDKNWDEKWDIHRDGTIKRQCSSKDDNTYDIIQKTVDRRWQPILANGSIDLTANKNKLTEIQNEILQFQKNASLLDGKPDPNNGGVKLYKKFANYYLDLRCDKKKGFDYFNRVKIDWDKDKKWDEKWDIRKDGTIKRQYSSKDNNSYDVVQETVDGSWQNITADNSTIADNKVASNESSANSNGLTAIQKEILQFHKNTSLSDGKPDPNNGGVKLYKKFANYYLDLRCDKKKGFDYFNRVKIDWDKDKKWDEKWDIRKDGSIKRQCSTKDDKHYDVVWEFKQEKWTKK